MPLFIPTAIEEGKVVVVYAATVHYIALSLKVS